jgi:hypothetical protein
MVTYGNRRIAIEEIDETLRPYDPSLRLHPRRGAPLARGSTHAISARTIHSSSSPIEDVHGGLARGSAAELFHKLCG